jgi:hypothetical protein
MREALAIFRKDVRCFRWQIAGFAVFAALHGCMDAALPRRVEQAGIEGVAELFLLVAAWCLTLLVVYEERPASGRQDWLTRPIPWQSLVVAKLLFLVAFIHVPTFLAQIAALAWNGFSPVGFLPKLLATHLDLFATAIVPAAALATVTNGIGQFMLAGLVIGGVTTLVSNSQGSSDLWSGITLGALAGVILFAYARRRTWTTRSIFAGLCVLSLLPAPELPARGDSSAPLRLEFDTKRMPSHNGGYGYVGFPRQTEVEASIPIRYTGEAGIRPVLRRVSAEVEGGGERWTSGWQPAGQVMFGPGQGYVDFRMPARRFDGIKQQPARLHLTAEMTLYSLQAVTKLPVPVRARWVPGAGFCSTPVASSVQCLAPMRQQYWTVSGYEATTPQGPYGMFSVWVRSGGLSQPIGGRAEISIETYAERGRAVSTVDIDAIRLADYETARWRRGW